MSPSTTRRRFCGFLTAALVTVAVAILGGCGYPKHIDPPLYERAVSSVQLAEEARLHARDLPGGDGRYYFVLTQGSHSMHPAIQEGDYIVVAGKANRSYASLKVGEIITYTADWVPVGSPPVTHRLVHKDSYGWVLSGDNNRESEPRWRVTEKTYIGVVVARYRLKKG